MSLFTNKKKAQHIEVDNYGVIGDKFYKKDILRSVLLASTKSYELAKKKDIDLTYGLLGENILLNYNPYNLAVGTKIYIGSAVLEISQHCTICKSLSKIDNSLPKLLKKDRGVFAKVIKNGIISINDKIKI